MGGVSRTEGEGSLMSAQARGRIFYDCISEKVTETKITGVAAYPGISRNRILYLPEELMRADGVKVPVYWDHDYARPPIGEAVFSWDPKEGLLRYSANILPGYNADHVSIGAYFGYEESFHGYMAPRQLTFYELSLTSSPGFPLTSVALAERFGRVIVESYLTPRCHITVAPANSTISGAGATLQARRPEGDASRMLLEKVEDSQKRGEKVSESPSKQEAASNTSGTNTQNHDQEAFLEILRHEMAENRKALLEELNGTRIYTPRGKEDRRAKITQSADRMLMSEDESERERRFYEELAEKLFGQMRAYELHETAFRFSIPRLDLPPVGFGSPLEAVKERARALEGFREKVRSIQRRVTEALATTTTGASLGVEGVSPLVVIPNSLLANLRDIVNWIDIPQGADRARWGTIKVASAGPLTENTEPTEASQTLTTVDATPSPRGIQQSVSFELEQKSVGGSMIQAVVESFRLSYLEDIDGLIAAEASTATPAATLYGDESVSTESNITSSMTFAPARIATAIREITKKGYGPDGLVAVVHPVQFDALLKHADVRQAHIFGEGVQVTGVLPSLYGVEVRRSTKVTTGTGSGAATTYRAWVCKKGVTFGVAASRDLQIETFRDIRKNQTVIKAHWDVAVKAIEPDSFVKIITA